MYDVIVVGNYTIDLIFTGLPRFPVLGEDTVGTGFEMIPGESYTSAVAMHRLGLNVGWAGDFGNDLLSNLALEFVRREGLDESLFVHHERPLRRVSAAASFHEDRAFMTYYDPDPQPPAALHALLTSSARAVYIPGLYYGPDFDEFARLLHSRGSRLVMDGNCDPGAKLENAQVRQAIESVQVFLPNIREVLQITGETDLERGLLTLGLLCPLVAVKAGAQGAYGFGGQEILHEPAIPVEAAETTGAGDCFSAGFTAAWLEGRPLRECLRWGNIAGGLSTQKLGGTGQFIRRREVEEWLERM